MEITRHPQPGALEFKVVGRLDAHWSEHLGKGIEEAMREGQHHLRLNFAEVTYLSSAGIRVLLKYFKQLHAIQGSFAVVTPSPEVSAILDMAGLSYTLVHEPVEPTSPRIKPSRPFESEHAQYEVYEVAAGATLQWNTWGQPGKFAQTGFTEADARTEEYAVHAMGVGLGAFGNNFGDCHSRFGEFLAVGGAAACLPTDGVNTPDFVVSEGKLVPQVQALYSISASGRFGRLARFEVKPAVAGSVPLTEIVQTALKLANNQAMGFVIAAECAGLVGAALRRSPVKTNGSADPMAFPGVRDWLSFTTERAFDRTMVLAAGFAAPGDGGALAPFMRPLGTKSGLSGHIHAAVFPYRPLQRGYLDLPPVVKALFGSEAIQGLLHLIVDDRKIDGVGESEFVRGACWFGPLAANATSS